MLEHWFELWEDFFLEEEGVCGCWNKSRGPTRGPQGRGHARGGGHALDPRGQVLAPPDVFSVPNILKYSRRNHISVSGHLKNFYFQGIFYCTDNSENRQKVLFLLYLI